MADRTFRSLAMLFALTACGGGADGPTPPDDDPEIPVAVVTITSPTATMVPGQIVDLSAQARENGQLIQHSKFTWSSNGRSIALGAQAYAMAPGNTIIRANHISGPLGSGLTTVSVSQPVPTAGSFLTIGAGPFGSSLAVTRLITSDTAAAGTDRRIAVVRTSTSELPPSLRATHPLLDRIVECSDGLVFGFEEATAHHGDNLWRIDRQSGHATRVAELDIGPVSALTCEGTTSLIVANLPFDVASSLYRVNRSTGAVQLIREPTTTEAIAGLAFSPEGVLFGTVFNTHQTFPQPQLLVTINTTTGVPTPVGQNQPPRLPQVHDLFFRGDRLFGVTGTFGGSLRELDPATGANTLVRTLGKP